MSSPRGSVTSRIFGIVAVIAVVGGIAWYLAKTPNDDVPIPNSNTAQSNQATNSAGNVASSGNANEATETILNIPQQIPTTEFSDEAYGFSIEYPTSWTRSSTQVSGVGLKASYELYSTGSRATISVATPEAAAQLVPSSEADKTIRTAGDGSTATRYEMTDERDGSVTIVTLITGESNSYVISGDQEIADYLLAHFSIM